MFASTAEALHGATWTPWRSGHRGDYELRNNDEVVATLRMVHLRWRRRAQGEFLGQPWVLEETRGGFIFRDSWGSDQTIAHYKRVDLRTTLDAEGPVYHELPDGAVVDEAGNILLEGRSADFWKDDAVPVLRLGEFARIHPHLHFLVLLREYLRVSLLDSVARGG